MLVLMNSFIFMVFILQTADGESTQEQNDALYRALVDGIAHLCKWKSSFLLFLAWKYQVRQP
jgi:hypothetical protein